jgi:hypothetical protein
VIIIEPGENCIGTKSDLHRASSGLHWGQQIICVELAVICIGASSDMYKDQQ